MATTVVTAPQIHQIAVGEVRNIVVSFDGKQEEGDILATVSDVVGDNLVTVPALGQDGGPTIIASTTRINNKRVLPNKAITFTGTGFSVGTETLTVEALASTGETLIGYIILEVVDNG